MRNLKVTRDSLLFATGLTGVIYETIAVQADRPSLLVLFGGMMGLPAFLRRDEKKKDGHDDDDHDDDATAGQAKGP